MKTARIQLSGLKYSDITKQFLHFGFCMIFAGFAEKIYIAPPWKC